MFDNDCVYCKSLASYHTLIFFVGAIVYIKNELNLESIVEGIVVAMSLIGATSTTTCSRAICVDLPLQMLQLVL